MGAGCMLVVIAGLLLPKAAKSPVSASGERLATATGGTTTPNKSRDERPRALRHPTPPEGMPGAEETVAEKVGQFAPIHLAIRRAMAEKFKVELPPEVGQFFAAVEAGRWAEAVLSRGTSALKKAEHELWRVPVRSAISARPV